jgi:hypothetical protein
LLPLLFVHLKVISELFDLLHSLLLLRLMNLPLLLASIHLRLVFGHHSTIRERLRAAILTYHTLMDTFFDGAAISLVTVARPAALFGKLKVLWNRSTRLFCIVASTSSQLAVGDTSFVHTEAYEVLLDGFSNRRMLAILEGLVSS